MSELSKPIIQASIALDRFIELDYHGTFCKGQVEDGHAYWHEWCQISYTLTPAQRREILDAIHEREMEYDGDLWNAYLLRFPDRGFPSPDHQRVAQLAQRTPEDKRGVVGPSGEYSRDLGHALLMAAHGIGLNEMETELIRRKQPLVYPTNGGWRIREHWMGAPILGLRLYPLYLLVKTDKGQLRLPLTDGDCDHLTFEWPVHDHRIRIYSTQLIRVDQGCDGEIVLNIEDKAVEEETVIEPNKTHQWTRNLGDHATDEFVKELERKLI
jgi:hypothetical protein